ncbi:hypothetical protein WMY93_024756 [Mugilogobius chulae]|uniref:Uncharacterized protein n=1 Tax=Mugilogobius chulae TaxID=88201 RepID=A0AAW0N0L2_9GOBI
MSKKIDVVRALVNKRLTAAAEEIFALVERTIVEYEEELCRSKEENQRKQQLLDSLLSSHNSHRTGVQFEPVRAEEFVPSSDPEEQNSSRHDEDELAFIPDILVKGEDSNLSSLFQQNEQRVESQGRDYRAESQGASVHFRHFEQTEKVQQNNSDSDEEWQSTGNKPIKRKRSETDGNQANHNNTDSLEMILNDSFSDNDNENKRSITSVWRAERCSSAVQSCRNTWRRT